jgi:two-component SAPR family response regulator
MAFIKTFEKVGDGQMNTIMIAEDFRVIHTLESTAKEILEMELLGSFCDEYSALQYVMEHKVDLVIVNKVMGTKEGGMFRSQLKKTNPDMVLIYIASGEEQTRDVTCLRPITVLPKDFSKEELDSAVKTAYLFLKQGKRKIYARTFGHFDVFVDGKPIMFKSAKAKELLAFLIDRRGGTVTTDQMINALWEDRPNDESTQNLCSKLVRTLQKELQASHAEEMLVVTRGNRHVDTDTFRCDLYEMLDGSERVREQYMGEYLLDYSWSETRTALLDRFLQ